MGAGPSFPQFEISVALTLVATAFGATGWARIGHGRSVPIDSAETEATRICVHAEMPPPMSYKTRQGWGNPKTEFRWERMGQPPRS